jgi:anti-anti-sigma factor
MTCEVEMSAGVAHIRGEMTIYEAAALKALLFKALDSEPGHCAVDLAGVSELDTTGVQLLLLAQRTCAARGATFTLTNPSSVVRDTFELLHTPSWLTPLTIAASV